MSHQSKGKCRWNDEIYKLKIWIVSEKVLPVLTTYISHPSSSSYNIIFLCTMLDSRHRCETIISEKEWWGNFFFSFFLFSTHIHTRSQWIFFFFFLSFSLSFHYLFFLFLFIFNWSIFLLMMTMYYIQLLVCVNFYLTTWYGFVLNYDLCTSN